jgi:hypothetical protein
VLYAGVYSFLSVCQLFNINFKPFLISTNLSTKHKFILFFFCDGNPKTALKGGYLEGRRKLFCQPLVLALARVGLQMCLRLCAGFYMAFAKSLINNLNI